MNNRTAPPRTFPRRHPLATCLASLLVAQAGSLGAMAPAPAPVGGLPVANCNDAGSGSLRAAVAAAASGDTLDLSALSCSTITLTSGALAIGAGIADLSVRGPANATLTISGNQAVRVFEHAGSGTLDLRDLTLSAGHADARGGCVLAAGNLSLQRVVAVDCVAGADAATTAAGGAFAVGGNAVLLDSELRGNRVDGQGLVRGGAISASGTLRATNTRFADNHARSHLGDGAGAFDNVAEGGAIQALAATTLISSTVTGNTATSDSYEVFGGGISVGSRDNGAELSSLTLRDTDVTANAVDSQCGVCAPQGGGAFVVGHALLNHARVLDNTVGSLGHYGGGGGIRFSGSESSVEILDSTISGNTADSAGGGMIGPGMGTLAIARTRIAHNHAGNEGGTNEGGGGILCFACTLQMVDSSVTGNSAGADGGGIGLLFGDYVSVPSSVFNSTISGNDANEGGGLFVDGGEIQINNSTIAFNLADERGAGFSADAYTYTIQLQSSIIAGNSTAGAANNVWAFPKTVSGANNLIPNAAGLPAELPADTLTADPLLLPLAENGGPTPTHALASTSPAIDAGNNTIGFIFDQRGAEYWREFGAAPDIGAFELQPPPDGIFAASFED